MEELNKANEEAKKTVIKHWKIVWRKWKTKENIQYVVLEASKEATNCKFSNADKLKIDGLEGKINHVA